MKKRLNLLLSFLVSLGLVFAGTASVAHAGLVDSATLIDLEQRTELVDDIRETLSQEALTDRFLALGVDPADIQERLAQLTDEELTMLHSRLEDLPAGGNDLLVALGIVFIVLIILEALGITNIMGV